MTIDKELKQRKIPKILENVRYLERVQKKEVGDFLSNYETILATRQAIQETVQICLDIAFHVCARNKLPAPSSYKDVFTILANNSLLTKDLAKKMENWTGLRNIITHIYEEIDDQQIFEIISKDLGDFEIFLKEIEHLEET